jgi:GTP-binding protein
VLSSLIRAKTSMPVRYASGSDGTVHITPKTLLTLEECMEYIQQDECIEVTPNFIRMRKTILNEEERKKFQKMLKTEEA